jgi:hypothetical protein
MVIGFVSAYSISATLVIIFSCNPVKAVWEVALQELPTTKCINYPASYIAQAAINIFTDLFIFILPMPIIWVLQLSPRQKISISSIFAIGLL